MTDITCPACGAEFDLTVAFACEEERRAFARLASVSIPLGTRVLKYIALFTPPKQRLTSAKKLKLLMQLLPDLERKAITHKGRDWTAPLDAWAQAFDQMQAARESGRLELPMKGHGYLFAILSGMADKHEAAAEQQREQERRTVGRAHSSAAPTSVGELLAAAPVGHPAAAPRPAAPAPSPGTSPTVRAMRAQVKAPKGQP